MKKRFLGAVFTACLVVLFVVVFSECATAQSTEIRSDKRGIPWNNHAYFEARPKSKFLNWSDYMESVDGKTLTTWAMFAGAGAMWGMREAYHAEPTVFETRWGVSESSWFGSEAWKRSYFDNDPENGHKNEILGNFGRDVHHTFGTGAKAFMFAGTFSIGCRKQPVKYRVLNGIIGYGVQSLFASLTYNVIRR